MVLSITQGLNILSSDNPTVVFSNHCFGWCYRRDNQVRPFVFFAALMLRKVGGVVIEMKEQRGRRNNVKWA